MKKIKRYAEGKAVTTRSDDEIEYSSKHPYQKYPGEGWKEREKEQGEKNLEALKSFGRKLFGGSSEDSSKFDELESVKKTKTLEEQIGRKATPKTSDQDTEEKSNMGERAQTKMMPKGNYEYKGPMPEASDEEPKPIRKTNKEAAPKREAAPKADAAPKKSIGEGSTTLPGKSSDKAKKPQNLPGNPNDKVGSNYVELTKRLKDIEAEKAEKAEKERKRGQGFTPYEKGKSIKDWAKMMDEGHKAQADKKSAESKDNEENYATKKKRERAGRSAERNTAVYGMKKGGTVSSASKRADGIAQRGKTKGRIC